MPIRKSIRDVQNSNTISDIVSVEPVKKTKVKVVEQITEIISNEDNFIPLNQNQTESEPVRSDKFLTIPSRYTTYKKVMRELSQIKTIYLIALAVIILGIAAFLLIPSSTQKDPSEQSKKEAEIVKKQ